ncbi:MAG TPA: allantoicase [Streptosporangiaceae bacterium]|nr:allantoicase [Streptosporangiaceae bacterium]
MSSSPSPDFTALPDLASRWLGGSVMYANDDFFAEKENLIKPEAPAFDPAEFGQKGKIYDGWETRRRTEPGHDHAIVRLGCPGIVHGVVIDTAFFRGNYPPEISVEAACADGYPGPAELPGLSWHELVGKSPAAGHAANSYPVADRRRWTHLRLSIYPDGGVARFRVHGEVVPDPAFLSGTIDLAALENGGRVAGCSNAFYSSPEHLIMPGRARVMSDGWENARRRDAAGDYVELRLAAAGLIRYAVVDTSYFVGNAPGWIELSATSDPCAGWRGILPKTRVQPDTRHRFRIDDTEPATHVRLDVIPDGGLARLRLHGELTAAALAAAGLRWRDSTPQASARELPRDEPAAFRIGGYGTYS